ncbi:MAG: NUDIX hydrolase [Bacillota bacterium]|jgi:ADP-ribose pyrophosphatase YjhB (NUDIX family)|uniref:NUDIX domain-containing protein n=1 Tax=Bacillus sp. RO2 TaxID=2723913 RepID=UPI00145D0436|nr:NUDIX hydrolase [Bacillus sp. RO2]MEA3320317.1 NUDIX hydrolase [Bacillota bacterium]NMH75423.1 NUDIX hydrolase [Bacillus sp. RO2]
MGKRENVWLAVAGIVVAEDGKWLVVKKRYGGLKGKWSFPAGFVEANETVDEAVVREILEETGINVKVEGLVGVRSGVIKDKISDNMLLFLCTPLNHDVVYQESELSDAAFKTLEELELDPDSSLLIHYCAKLTNLSVLKETDAMNPGQVFNYSSYKLFF